MSWVLSASGTQTSIVGTEITLTTDTTNATFYFEVDLNNLAGGDIVELRVYTTTLAAGISRVVWKSSYGPIPTVAKIAASPPQPSDQSLKVTLWQTAGTARTFPWKLLRV